LLILKFHNSLLTSESNLTCPKFYHFLCQTFHHLVFPSLRHLTESVWKKNENLEKWILFHILSGHFSSSKSVQKKLCMKSIETENLSTDFFSKLIFLQVLISPTKTPKKFLQIQPIEGFFKKTLTYLTLERNKTLEKFSEYKNDTRISVLRRKTVFPNNVSICLNLKKALEEEIQLKSDVSSVVVEVG